MTQNIYDTDSFFEGYSQLPRSLKGLDGAPEWASIRALMPPLDNANVADLGCGFGWFCRWAREQSAASVLGVDVSQNMLSKAEEMTSDAHIQYVREDLETLTLPENSFDLVYSSLTLHYIANLQGLFEQAYKSLKPGGWLIFSAEHPIYTAPRRPGWAEDQHKNTLWPINQYLVEGPRTTDWLADGVVKQHRTLGTYLMMLINAGFTLKHLEEWRPSAEQIEECPELKVELERPMFFIAAAQRVE
ncbi:class I SAM-dependent methyltransferase [Hahella aquimaris]|uniref:class I SAM-dependent methyltransferase n=1 Tax=Hahella sp. HNIBRBA332 TaxID=3015983 RepID=UPI00273A7ED4|nr:class I SAM-dependent methyltransferase [Hahella sp. HNIBRBA332]WLQ12154.1 class I SAM-dependent methyltransferase [Hahella sp. HNIBRBA332]